MVTSKQFDLVVAGRGIVGSACALAAAQLGLRTALVGRPVVQRATAWDDRVYAIAPAARAWLDSLRIGRLVDKSRLAPVRAMRIAERSASTLELTSYGAAVPELAAIVEARELHRVIDIGISVQPRVAVEDVEIESCHFTEDAGVLVGRSPGGAETSFSAPLLIAADGPDSTLRKAASIDGRSRDYVQRGIVVRLRLARPHHGVASQWFLDDSVLAVLPLAAEQADSREPSRHASLVWSVDDDVATRLLQLDPVALAREIATACGQPADFVEVLAPPQSFPLRYFVTDSMVAPRLALVGDAAHLMHPLAGQGLNTGLRDAEALIATLAARESFRDLGDLRLLRRYARMRAEPVARILMLTDGLQRLFKPGNPLLGTMRAAGMALIEGLPPVKRRLVHQAVGSDAAPFEESYK